MSTRSMKRTRQVVCVAAVVAFGALAFAARQAADQTKAVEEAPAAAATDVAIPPATNPFAVEHEPSSRPEPVALIAPSVGPVDYYFGPPSADAGRPAVEGTALMRWLKTDPDHNGGYRITGYVQGAYTYNPHHNSGDTIFGRSFDDEFGDGVQLDQFELSLQKIVARDRFDVGGRIEVIYGYDTYAIHANGLNFYGDCCGADPNQSVSDAHDPRFQLDLTQAYLDVNLHAGTGLLVRVGKFVTPIGYETIDPTTTPFYSRSYLFGFAKPFTHTGVILNYRLDDHWAVWGGVVRGWDQALEDDNDSVSFVGRIDWKPSDAWDIHLGGMFGREASGCAECDGSDGSRQLIDLTISHAVTDRLTLGAEGLYGRSGSGDENDNAAEWFGGALYLAYDLNDRARLNTRVEWFRDQDGTRLLTGDAFEGTSATVGLAITPFPADAAMSGLKIQPEVRYDHATSPEFDGGHHSDQITIGVSVLYAF